jgi:hypothetical protein
VTVVGHSLGGGIALQFAYQFPERSERLVLISSGGLGPQLTPMLRAATLPGAQTVVAGLALVPQTFTRRALSVVSSVAPALLAGPDAGPVAEGLRRLTHAGQRRTFIRTARTVINWRGQTISATQHLKQLAGLPVMLAWGSDDRTIPPHHHRAVADLLTEPHLLEIDGAGHYPHETAADRLLPALHRFLGSTAPFRYADPLASTSHGTWGDGGPSDRRGTGTHIGRWTFRQVNGSYVERSPDRGCAARLGVRPLLPGFGLTAKPPQAVTAEQHAHESGPHDLYAGPATAPPPSPEGHWARMNCLNRLGRRLVAP